VLLSASTALLHRPQPPPNLRPGWEVIKLGGRGKPGCMQYTVVDGDTCQSIAYQPDLAPDGTTVGPLFITRGDGSLCRRDSELALNEAIRICRIAMQGTIGTFPPAGHSSNPPLKPPPLSGAGALSPCYNQLIVNGVVDKVGDGTYTGDVGALSQIGAAAQLWKAEVPGRQLLLLVNNVQKGASVNIAFTTLIQLANAYGADGFVFASFLGGKDKTALNQMGDGAALDALVDLIKDNAPNAFIAFVAGSDYKEYSTAWGVINPKTRVDTIGWIPGEGEDSRFQSYPEGGSSDGTAKRFPGNTWEHSSYYTYAWSWCFLGAGTGMPSQDGIGLGVWGLQKPTPNMYGTFMDSVEIEYYGYSGTDEQTKGSPCGPSAATQANETQQSAATGRGVARPRGWSCGDIGPVHSAPATGACRGHCCGTDYALQQYGVAAATCKLA
jgi:hypothetical protein